MHSYLRFICIIATVHATWCGACDLHLHSHTLECVAGRCTLFLMLWVRICTFGAFGAQCFSLEGLVYFFSSIVAVVHANMCGLSGLHFMFSYYITWIPMPYNGWQGRCWLFVRGGDGICTCWDIVHKVLGEGCVWLSHLYLGVDNTYIHMMKPCCGVYLTIGLVLCMNK